MSRDHSYKMRSVFRSMKRVAFVTALFALMIAPIAVFAETLESEGGTMTMEDSSFILERTGQTIVKVFGVINLDAIFKNVVLTHTTPDGDSVVHKVMTNKDGYYEYYFVHDWESKRGSYDIHVGRNSTSIGTMSYELVQDPSYRTDDQVKREYLGETIPQRNIVSSESQMQESDKIPTWVKNVFGWYYMDRVSESELINAIEHLIKTNVITLE